jgi:hypothetical protein
MAFAPTSRILGYRRVMAVSHLELHPSYFLAFFQTRIEIIE